MSDLSNPTPPAVSPAANQALIDLEAQISGLEAMLPGARAAKMDTTQIEATIKGLRTSISALKSIPGVG